MSTQTSPMTSSMSLSSIPTSSVSSDTLTPADLQQEFSLINLNIANLTLEEMNANKRFCVISASNNVFSCKLKITFPITYPNDVPPSFMFIDLENENKITETNMREETRDKLLLSLQNTAHIQVKRNRPCLEPCLRDFMSTFDKITLSNSLAMRLNSVPSITDYSMLSDSFDDAHVPFPKTCGATFCGGELLICFARPPHLQQINAATECTPRALSALSSYLLQTAPQSAPSTLNSANNSIVNNSNIRNISSPDSTVPFAQSTGPSISSFYFNSRKKTRHRPFRKHFGSSIWSPQGNQSVNSKCGLVVVYSVAGILPCSRLLAENYVFSNDVVDMCQKNASVAASFNRKDLVQTWTLAGLCADGSVNCNYSNNVIMDAPWSQHPAGRKLIQSLIDYYLNTCGDYQTAAMLCCAFSYRCLTCGKPSCVLKPCKSQLSNSSPGNSFILALSKLLKPGNSPYHTVNVPSNVNSIVTEGSWDEWNLIESLRRHRSNSWSDSLETCLFTTTSLATSPYQSPGMAYRIHCNEMTLLRDQREVERHEFNTKIIDPKLVLQYDCIKQVYADLLLRWKLHQQRAQMLKYVSSFNFQLDLGWKHINFTSICNKCKSDCHGPQCKCHEYSLKCIVCRISVKGSAIFCIACGHGGHTLHMNDWFSKMDECASGCGCKCLSYNLNECFP